MQSSFYSFIRGEFLVESVGLRLGLKFWSWRRDTRSRQSDFPWRYKRARVYRTCAVWRKTVEYSAIKRTIYKPKELKVAQRWEEPILPLQEPREAWNQSLQGVQAWCCWTAGRDEKVRVRPLWAGVWVGGGCAEFQGRWAAGGECKAPLRTQNKGANLEANSFQLLKGSLVLWSKANGGSVRGYVTRTWKMTHVWPSREFHNRWNSSQSLAQFLICFMFLMSTTVSKQLVAAGAFVREGGQMGWLPSQSMET